MSDDLTSKTDAELGALAGEGNVAAVMELSRRHPIIAATQTAAAPAPNDGTEIVRDVYVCTCGHPASEVVLDLNAHSLDHPFKCHVDRCPCQGFVHAAPFRRRSDTAPTPATPTGRFASS